MAKIKDKINKESYESCVVKLETADEDKKYMDCDDFNEELAEYGLKDNDIQFYFMSGDNFTKDNKWHDDEFSYTLLYELITI